MECATAPWLTAVCVVLGRPPSARLPCSEPLAKSFTSLRRRGEERGAARAVTRFLGQNDGF